jgi:hypothetical protein
LISQFYRKKLIFAILYLDDEVAGETAPVTLTQNEQAEKTEV